MAFFAVACWDKPGALDARKTHRADHVAYLQARLDILRVAGPLLDAQGVVSGSLFVVEVPDQAAAEAFCAGDPFNQGGVFDKVDIRGFIPALGSWAQ